MTAKSPVEYRSIESIPKDSFYYESQMEFVREVVEDTDPPRKYMYFVDPVGRGWYKTMIHNGYGWISQEAYVFGAKKRRKRPS